MDYRNGDGSIAEMCGNGVRVFARYLQRAGHVEAGRPRGRHPRRRASAVHLAKDGDDHRRHGPRRPPRGRASRSRVGDRSWPARNVNMGNPHAVAFVDDLGARRRPVRRRRRSAPAAVYPDGVNVEFVVDRGPRHVAMRVHERGSGETRSCGTGACAVAVAAARRDGVDPAVTGSPVTYTVDVPGGTPGDHRATRRRDRDDRPRGDRRRGRDRPRLARRVA